MKIIKKLLHLYESPIVLERVCHDCRYVCAGLKHLATYKDTRTGNSLDTISIYVLYVRSIEIRLKKLDILKNIRNCS